MKVRILKEAKNYYTRYTHPETGTRDPRRYKDFYITQDYDDHPGFAIFKLYKDSKGKIHELCQIDGLASREEAEKLIDSGELGESLKEAEGNSNLINRKQIDLLYSSSGFSGRKPGFALKVAHPDNIYNDLLYYIEQDGRGKVNRQFRVNITPCKPKDIYKNSIPVDVFMAMYEKEQMGKNESLKENKTSYGDTTIEDYVNANFSGDADSKKKFVSAMKKKANGKDYFNGINMSVKDWEKVGQKFGLSMKKHPVSETLYKDESLNRKKRSLTEAMEKPYFRAFITNLGKYNEGELVGDWVDFPIDEDEFEEKLTEIGIGSEDEFGQPYEEWFVTDYECNLDAFEWEELGEYPSYETLQEFGELVDSIDDVEAVNNAYEVTGDLREAIEGLDSGDIYYYPGLSSWEDLAYYIIDEMYGGVENLDAGVQEQFFDYEALGRDLGFDTYESEDEDGNEVQLSAGEYFCGDENASDYEIGEAFVDQVGFDGVGNLENYFDYESYGSDFQYDGFTITSDGIIEYR